MEEREIDLKSVIWKVILSWRGMIIWGIVFAVALTGLMYYTDTQKYEKNKADMEDASKLESNLTAEEFSQVKSVLDYIDELDELRDYRDTAPAMKIDPYNAENIRYQFYVDVDYSDADNVLYVDGSGIIRTENSVGDITSVCAAYLNSDEFLNSVIASLGYSMKESELRDIIEISVYNGIVNFSVYFVDGMSTDGLADTVLTLLKQKVSTLDIVGDANIELVNQQINTERNQGLIDKKSNLNGKIVDLENRINALKAGLNSEQLYYVERVRPKEELEEAGIQIKFAIIGFILGVFLVCGVVFVKGVLSSKLALADELESVFAINILGVVFSPDNKKRFLQFVDNALLKIKNRRVKQLSDDKRLEFAVTSIAIKCEQLATKKLFISGTEIENIDSKLVETIIDKLAKEGISAEVIDNIYYDGKALKKCVECGYVLFIEKVGESIYNEINNQVNKAKEYDLNIIGAIAVN